MISIPVVRYLGDQQKAITYKPYGLQLLIKVHEFMSFQNLKAHRDTRILNDGTVIVASSIFGIDTVYINCPVVKPIIDKMPEEELVLYRDLVIITCKAKPWDPEGTGLSYNLDEWSIVWDIAKDRMATGITNNEGALIEFPCLDTDLDNWRDNLTTEKSSYASLTVTQFDWPVWGTPWTDVENIGVEIYRTGGEGVMCHGDVYNWNQYSYWTVRSMTADRYKFVSNMPLGGTECMRVLDTNIIGSGWWPYYDGLLTFGKSVYGHFDIQYNSPLGNFETLVTSPQPAYILWTPMTLPGDPSNGYNWSTIVPLYYEAETWTNKLPTMGYYCGYSEKSHLQLYVMKCNNKRQEIVGGTYDSFEWDTRYQSKLQIHAGCAFHPANAEFISPLSLSRSHFLETALLDLLNTQLVEEEVSGQDWSLYQLDEDKNTTWIWHGGATYYSSEASDTWVFPVLYSLTFDISFREETEPIA